MLFNQNVFTEPNVSIYPLSAGTENGRTRFRMPMNFVAERGISATIREEVATLDKKKRGSVTLVFLSDGSLMCSRSSSSSSSRGRFMATDETVFLI